MEDQIRIDALACNFPPDLIITVLPTVKGECGLLALFGSFPLCQDYPYPVAASSVLSRH